MDIQQADEFMEQYADDIANLLRSYARRWNGDEQVDDTLEDEIIKRYFIGYELAEEGVRPHVFMQFWYGGSGDIVVERDGRSVSLKPHALDYPVAKIDIVCMPEKGEDFAIDGQHVVHSMQELNDRMGVMWNADHWGVRAQDEHLKHNAQVHRAYVPLQGYYKKSLEPVSITLRKLGEAWQGEEQTDNTPDLDDAKGGGLGGLIGGKRNSGKKRFAVGYSAPLLKRDKAGKARITTPAVWVDMWEGGKGTLKKTAHASVVELEKGQATRIAVVFRTDEPLMVVDGHPQASARTPKDLQQMLVQLWKADAFGLKDG